MNQLIREGGDVRAILDGDVKKFRILALPFGSPSKRDRFNQWLSRRTDIMTGIGDRRPLLYAHGMTPSGHEPAQPRALGVATFTDVDDRGWWVDAVADNSPLTMRCWNAALEGRCAASTMIPRPLERHDELTGEVLTWPVAEVSIFDRGGKFVPASDDAVVIPMRMFFEQVNLDVPEGLEAGEDNSRGSERTIQSKTGGPIMDAEVLKAINDGIAAGFDARAAAIKSEEEARATMRASILEELKANPKEARSIFNVTQADPTKGQDAGKQETYAYMRALVQDARRVADGGLPVRFTQRGMEESEAAELGALVPDDLYAGISEIRGKYSLVRKSGMFTYTTDKLTFTVPTETAGMAVLPTIAEEGAYVENAPATVAKTATMLKKGSLVTVSEESLEDIPILQAYITRAAGKAMALAENAVLEGLLESIDGVEIATQHTILDSEILTAYYALPQEYRDEAVWVMNDLTVGYLRAMLVATPRAYGDIGFETRMMGDVPGEFFLQHRVFTNAGWDPITTAADDVKVIDFVNLSETIAWADRRGLSIFVDPYTQRAAAGQVQFLASARFAGVVLRTTALSGIDDHA